MRDLTPERLTRLLAMITYFSDGRQVPFAQAAAHFGISEKQLLDDVNTLWVSGAPGYTHAELLDFEASAFDEGLISLRESQQMDRPLRLSASEAVTLLVALNSLIARLGENEELRSARKKLQAAAGEAAEAAEAIHIARTPEATQSVRETVERALAQGTQLWLHYVSGTDEESTRTVDPGELNAIGDHWVLTAWCHRARGERQFRLDRILEIRPRDTPVSNRATTSRFAPMDTSQFAHRVELRLLPRARWVVEQIPVESVTEDEDSFTAVIAADDPAWLDQLCLRLGDSLLSIHPPSAAERVRRLATDALAAYEG